MHNFDDLIPLIFFLICTIGFFIGIYTGFVFRLGKKRQLKLDTDALFKVTTEDGKTLLVTRGGVRSSKTVEELIEEQRKSGGI